MYPRWVSRLHRGPRRSDTVDSTPVLGRQARCHPRGVRRRFGSRRRRRGRCPTVPARRQSCRGCIRVTGRSPAESTRDDPTRRGPRSSPRVGASPHVGDAGTDVLRLHRPGELRPGRLGGASPAPARRTSPRQAPGGRHRDGVATGRPGVRTRPDRRELRRRDAGRHRRLRDVGRPARPRRSRRPPRPPQPGVRTGGRLAGNRRALAEGLLPQYRTLEEWTGSVRLAEDLGYTRYVSALLVTLEDA